MKININPSIPAVSKPDDKTKTDIRYMVISPYVSIHIFWDNRTREMVYEVEEPILNNDDKEVLDKIQMAMREMVNINIVNTQEENKMISYIDKTARLIISELGLKVSENSYEKIFYYLYRNFVGLNEVEALMQDYFIEDIECNGVNQPIYIVHRVFRNLRTNIRFNDVDNLASFVEKLAQKTGKYISYASPLLDGSLPDGSRVNTTYTKDVS